MKLHLPNLLRKALLACMAVVSTIACTVASGADVDMNLLSGELIGNWTLEYAPGRNTPPVVEGNTLKYNGNWRQNYTNYAFEGAGATLGSDNTMSFSLTMSITHTNTLCGVALVGTGQTLVLGSPFYNTNDSTQTAGGIGYGLSDNVTANMYSIKGTEWSESAGQAACAFTQFTVGGNGVVVTSGEFSISGSITLTDGKYLLDLNYGDTQVVNDLELTDGLSSITRVVAYYDGPSGHHAILSNMTLNGVDYAPPSQLTWNTGADDNNWHSSSWTKGEASAQWRDGDSATFSGAGETVSVAEGQTVLVGDVSVTGKDWVWDNEGTIVVRNKLTVGAASSLKVTGDATFNNIGVTSGSTLELAPGKAVNLKNIAANLDTGGTRSTIIFSGEGTNVSVHSHLLNSPFIVVKDGATLSFDQSVYKVAISTDSIKVLNGSMIHVSNGVDMMDISQYQKLELEDSELRLTNHRMTLNGEKHLVTGVVISGDALHLTNSKVTGTPGEGGVGLDFTGYAASVVSNGTSEISVPVRFGVAEAPTLFNVESGTLSLGQIVAGDGTLEKSGAGVLKFVSSAAGADASYLKGGLNLTAGEAQVAGELILDGASTCKSGTTLSVVDGGNLDFRGESDWKGTVSVATGGTLTLNSVHTISGTLAVNGGVVKLGTLLQSVGGAELTLPEAGTNGWAMAEVVFLKTQGAAKITGMDKVINGAGEEVSYKNTNGTYTALSTTGTYYVQNTSEKAEYSRATGLTGATSIIMSAGTTLVVKDDLSSTKLTLPAEGAVSYEVDGAEMVLENVSAAVSLKSLALANGGKMTLKTGENAVSVADGLAVTGNGTLNANSCNSWTLGGTTEIASGGSLTIQSSQATTGSINALAGAGNLILQQSSADNKMNVTVAVTNTFTGRVEALSEGGNYTLNMAEGSTLADSRLANNGNKSVITLAGSGTYELGARATFDKNVRLADGWTGLVKVAGANITSSVDMGGLTKANSRLEISGLTLGGNGELTLSGAVTLGGTLNLAKAITVADGANLTFADDFKLNLTGVQAETTDEGFKYRVLSAGDLSALNSRVDSILVADFVNSVQEVGEWSFGEDGCLHLITTPADSVLVVEDTVAYDSATVAAVMNTIQLSGGELQVGNTAIAESLATLKVTAKNGAISGTGSVTEVSFDAITVSAGGTLTIKDGTTDLTLKTGNLTLNSGSQIVVEAGQVLDLSTAEMGSLFNKLAPAVSGAGLVKMALGSTEATNQVALDGNKSVNVDMTFSGSLLRLNAYHSGGSSAVTVYNDVLLESTGGTIRMESGASMEVAAKDGVKGTVQADAIQLGHANASGNQGHIIISGGELKTGSITKTSGSGGGSVTMSAGKLELTTATTIGSGVTTEITGGELVAKSASWGISGGKVGGATVTTEGDHSITLTDSTLTGTLTNSAGNLVLSGTTNIQTSGYQTVQTAQGYSNGQNGYAAMDTYYQLATDATKLTASGASFTLDGATSDRLSLVTDNSSAYYNWLKQTAAENEYGTVYNVRDGVVSYNSANAEFKAGTTQILVNGGTLKLETSLGGSLADKSGAVRIETAKVDGKPGTTLEIGANATLKQTQLGVATGVYLGGSGTYDIGSGLTIAGGVSLGDTWEGTVSTSVSNMTSQATLKLGAKVAFTAETFSTNSTLKFGNNTELTMNNLAITGIATTSRYTDDATPGTAMISGKTLTLNGSMSISRDVLAGLTTGKWLLVDVDTLNGLTSLDEIARAGANDQYKYSFTVENGQVIMTGETNGLIWGANADLGGDTNQAWVAGSTTDENVIFDGHCSGDDGMVKIDAGTAGKVAVKDVDIVKGADADTTTYTFSGNKLVSDGKLTVGEGMQLVISNDSTFLNGAEVKDTVLEVTADGKLTVGTETEAADMSAAGGLQVHAGAAVTVHGKLSTDTINIASLQVDADAVVTGASITAGELAASTAGSKITINLADDVVSTILTAMENAASLGFGLVTFTTGSAADIVLDTEDEQTILKAGHWIHLGLPNARGKFRASTTQSVGMQVTNDDTCWTVGDARTDSGLIVLENGALKSSDILDNIDTIKVRGKKDIDMQAAGITSLKLNNLTAADAAANLYVSGDGAAADTLTVSTPAGGYNGVLRLEGVTANLGTAAAPVKGATVVVQGDPVVLTGALEEGTLVVGLGSTLSDDNTLTLKNSTVGINMGAGNSLTDAQVQSILENGLADLGGVSDAGQVTVQVGSYSDATGFVESLAYEKYFTNMTLGADGVVRAERSTAFYSSKLAGETTNGKAGLALADAALNVLNPQADAASSLGAVLDQLDELAADGSAAANAAADELGTALAGASTAVLGMAASGDLDRQLKAIRNRTTTMGVDQSVVNTRMPYLNAWINAEGDYNQLSDSGTEGGYELSSWGGTVGFDLDITPTFTAGMALTAMYGDLTVTGVDAARGDLDTTYVSAFARYCASAWTHTFVATAGKSDFSMSRTVAGNELKGSTEGSSFGIMYEAGRVIALNEDGSACLQPIFNVTWRHTQVDGYEEEGSDLALEIGKQTYDTITFGLGARYQAVVGEDMYNRTSILEARVLAKFDAGDRQGSSEVSLAGATAEVESAEMGAIGLEAGAGITIPLGDAGSSIFADASVELRADYINVNGTVGYRINF